MDARQPGSYKPPAPARHPWRHGRRSRAWAWSRRPPMAAVLHW